MMRTLVTHPNKMLRRRSRELASLADLGDVVGDAIDTLLGMDGSGLALVQIGIPLRIIVLNCFGRSITLVNPKIIHYSGHVLATEACLSLPGRWVKIERYAHVKVEHLRPHGLDVIDADDPVLAVALQHEIDHLNGVLTLDRDSSCRPAQVH